MSRKVPATSAAAHEQVSYDMLKGHFKRIVDALMLLGTGNYEQISTVSGMDRHAVGRRLKELEDLKIVYKPGTTKTATKSGRAAYDYCLTGAGMPKTDNETKDPKVTDTLVKELKQMQLFT